MNKNKIRLILDSSVLEPIKFSIRGKLIQVELLQDFQNKTNTKIEIPSEIYKENFDGYVQIPLLGEDAPKENSTIQEEHLMMDDSRVTTMSKYNEGMSFHIVSVGDVRDIPMQVEESSQWKKLSNPDKACYYALNTYIDQGESAIVVANDKDLRFCASLCDLPNIGSTSLLAAMVLCDLISSQKGSGIYYSWKRTDPQWVLPRNEPFSVALNIEKQRKQKQELIWKNYE